MEASPRPSSFGGPRFVRADECQELPLRLGSLDPNVMGSRRRRREQVDGRPRSLSEASLTESTPRDSRLSETIDTSALFEDLTQLADFNRPVELDTFRPRSASRVSDAGSEVDEINGDDSGEEYQQEALDTELLEAYLDYCKSIGHEPNIVVTNSADTFDQDQDGARESLVVERAVLLEKKHIWTDFIGTRYSKRRGCVQFWTWLLLGVTVLVIMTLSLSSLELNEVLHLDAFVVEHVQVTQDYTYLHFLEEVDFHLTYTIETQHSETNQSYFNAFLLDENQYENYVDGEPFEYIAEGSTLNTTFAHLPTTYIDNTIEESMYFVVQPCYLARNPTVNYCQTGQLPTSVRSSEKIYDLDREKKMAKKSVWEHFNVTYMSVNPMPVSCSSSGWRGGAYLLLFLPFLIVILFGLRVFQMLRHRESFRKNLERVYQRELDIPDEEVDYWQPMPWDRKVAKTKLFGPCCWKKFRQPFEPFYTWWRHENYFTWVFFPYRNERLSRGERALIIVASLYITFYVMFLIVMLRDSWGSEMTIFTSVVLYAILAAVLPSLGKAAFKEVFKLIFRQRRKYYRAKALGGDMKGFSFRLAFLLQVLVALLLVLTQLPIFYIWAFRSCLFLQNFIYYAVLAAFARMSLLGLAQDLAWYLILKTWGWKDLCPHCTERIKHCDCFNDEVLIIAVEHLGPKWELIRVMDSVLDKRSQYTAQFDLYTAEQLHERWTVIVERAEKHMEDVEKLRAYQEKKRLDELRRSRIRRSFTNMLSFTQQQGKPEPGTNEMMRRISIRDSMESETEDEASDLELQLCHLREKKILEINSKIELDAFEKHYDSNISDVFNALTRTVMKRRRHSCHDTTSDEDGIIKHSPLARQNSSGSSSDGETMRVFDTPAQRLQRREEEKQQRKRAFRVLKDYKIENVDLHSEPTPSALSPSLSASGRARRKSSRNTSLLSTSQKTPTEDVVVVTAEVQADRDGNEGGDLEAGNTHTNRVYAVKKRPKTLLRQVSISAEAFAAWALDYDPKAAKKL